MNAHFKLFAGVLVDEGRAVYGELFLLGWERNRTDNFDAGAFSRLKDRTRSLVDDLVIIGADLDTDTMRTSRFISRRRLGFHVGHVHLEGRFPLHVEKIIDLLREERISPNL